MPRASAVEKMSPSETLPVVVVARPGWSGTRRRAWLARHPCLLVEQGRRRGEDPEDERGQHALDGVLSPLGHHEQVLDTPFPLDWPKDVVFITTLSGYELGRVKRLPRQIRASAPRKHPRPARQHWFDPIPQRSPAPFRRWNCAIAAASNRLSKPARRHRHLARQRPARCKTSPRLISSAATAPQAVRRASGIALTGQGVRPCRQHAPPRAGAARHLWQAAGDLFVPVDHGVRRVGQSAHHRSAPCAMAADGQRDRHDTAAEQVDKEAYLRRALGRDVAVDWVDIIIRRRQSAGMPGRTLWQPPRLPPATPCIRCRRRARSA